MKKKLVLVIGSNSFAGSHMCSFLLKKNFIVIGVSRSKIQQLFMPFDIKNKFFNFYQLDINYNLKYLISIIRKYKPKYIINYAAQGMVSESWKNPLHWYQTNIISHIKLVESIKNFKFIKKYINFSTPEVYGSTSGIVRENLNFKPTTPYALSRATADYHLINLNKFFNFPIIFTRTSNIYGPHQKLYRIIPKTIMSCLKKKIIYLHGSGKSVRSFIFIEDVSSATYKIIQKGIIGETYHISTNKFISIKNLVKKINKMLIKKKIYKNVKDRIGKDKYYFLSSDKIRRKLKWKDKVSLDLGLDLTVKWIRNNFKPLSRMQMEYVHKK